MPVADAPIDDEVGRFRRLSHTQADMHRRCPRMWYYRYPRGLLGGVHPIFGLGHAVEGALNRVMRDSPVLVPAESPSEIFDSPIHEVSLYGGADTVARPDPSSDADWPGVRLPTIDADRWPTDRESLRKWANQRADVHFEREWQVAKLTWEGDANRVGDWDSFERKNKNAAREMVNAGIEFHLDEVEECIRAGGGAYLSDWRRGEGREKWPSPDGFPYIWSTPHPAAGSGGEVSWVEAWEVARPWFCDPDAGQFSLASIHPEGWLQGEYDLVYRWTGEVRIFDVKASMGTSDFSSGYPEQLATYAYLWWSTHSKQQMVSDLQIWYLGVPVAKKIPLPDERALTRLENRLKPLHQKLKLADSHDISNYPANPSPVRTYLAGGVLSDVAPATGMARCASCEYSLICQDSPHLDDLANGGAHYFSPTSDALVDCTAVAEIDPYVTVSGVVRNPRYLPAYGNPDKENLEFFLDLADRSWLAVVIKQDDVKLPTGFATGSRIRIRNGVVAAGYKPDLGGHRRLDVGPKGIIESSTGTSTDDTPIDELREILYNVKGRIFCIDSNEKKWGVKLVDSTGSIPLTVWGEDKALKVLESYRPERGDEVVLTGATARDQYGKVVLNIKSNYKFQTRLWRDPKK